MQDREKLSVFPAFFKVAGKRVLVIGNGEEALAKLRLLQQTNAALVCVADDALPVLRDFLAEQDIEYIDRPFTAAMLEGAALIFAAASEIRSNDQVVHAARLANIPVNVVDHPALCDFYTPAIVNRAPIIVAIGSEGAGPVLAQIIRARIDALLAPSLGRLARFAGQFRPQAEMLQKGGERRSFWRRFFSGDVARAIALGDENLAYEAGLALLDNQSQAQGLISLFAVNTDEADNITLRGQRALMNADVILYNDDVSQTILDLARRDAILQPAMHRKGDAAWHAHTLAAAGKQVLRLYRHEDDMIDDIVTLSEATIAYEILSTVVDAEPAEGFWARSLKAKHSTKKAA